MRKAEVEAVIEAAILNGKARLALLIEEAGGLLTTSQAAQLLGIAAQQLDAKLPLIFISGDGGGYPRFQFESREMVESIAKVLSAMDVASDAAQLLFSAVGRAGWQEAGRRPTRRCPQLGRSGGLAFRSAWSFLA